MSEAIRCDYCKKSVILSDATDWWHIEPIRAVHVDDDDGGDFCSDRCASNFFITRLAAKSNLPHKEDDAKSDSFKVKVPGSENAV